MLISQRHGFLFVHIPKTAGTSITSALRPLASNKLKCEYNRLARRVGLAFRDAQPYKPHSTAAQLREKLGAARFDACFSFAFVRNPWDWLVSEYTYILRKRRHQHHATLVRLGDFDRYLNWRCARPTFQYPFVLADDGRQLVSFIGRYERLEADFREIARRIGVDAQLPMLNVSNLRPYPTYYTSPGVRLVARTYREDIERFGYAFDGVAASQQPLRRASA
jgi:hypothetical protein